MQQFDKSVIVILPVVIYLFSFLTLLYNEDFYSYLFVKTNVDISQAKELTKDLFDYFKNNDYSVPEIKTLTYEENSHILDVKILLTASAVIFLFLLVFSVFSLSRSEQKQKILLYGSILSVIFPFLFFLFNFSSFFTLFHLVFFPQGNWSFPVGSALVSVYTMEFFEQFVINIVFRGEIISVFIFVFYFVTKLYSQQQQSI